MPGPFTNIDPGYNGQGPLAALEAIIRVHQWMRTRKTLRLFSSNEFHVRREGIATRKARAPCETSCKAAFQSGPSMCLPVRG